jgi:hypothetical protein
MQLMAAVSPYQTIAITAKVDSLLSIRCRLNGLTAVIAQPLAQYSLLQWIVIDDQDT